MFKLALKGGGEGWESYLTRKIFSSNIFGQLLHILPQLWQIVIKMVA